MEVRGEFVASLGFEPDPFQVRAMDALDAGRSVLVAAPTGSGKPVVAEYAVARALAFGQKAFYTPPLKALSNQKYGDLVRRHGHGQVGLLTGDNAINGDARIVVMTTEVLRNMIYSGSSSLAGLRYVVLDEVHYLQNPYRGRCGRRSSSTCRTRCRWWRSAPRSRTPRRGPTGWPPSGVPRRR